MTAEPVGHPPLPPPTEEETLTYLATVAAALGDTPETVIALQFLQDESTDVLCVGDPADLEAIVIQSPTVPGEPSVFGHSAEAVGTLIPHLEGWFALNVPMAIADDLMVPVAEAAGVESVRLLDDVYFTLEHPVDAALAGDARLLTVADANLIDRAVALLGDGAARLHATIEWGHVAGVVREGSLVAVAYTFAQSPTYADIGVVTRDDWRGQGLATAAAARVSMAIQEAGRVPVWSTGSTNLASLRVADRIGFHEVSRRVYLIPELDDDPN